MNARNFIGASVLTITLMLGAAGSASAGHVTKELIEMCQGLVADVDTDIGKTGLSNRVQINLLKKTACIDNKLESAIDKLFPVARKVKPADGQTKLNQALVCAVAFEDRIMDLDTHDKIDDADADQLLGGDDGPGGGNLEDGGIDAVIDCLENDLHAEIPVPE